METLRSDNHKVETISSSDNHKIYHLMIARTYDWDVDDCPMDDRLWAGGGGGGGNSKENILFSRMCSLTGSTIICCRSLFKLAVWCCPLPQPPRIIHCWCLNLPFQCWSSFNSYPRLCVSICYIVKLSIDILWFSFHGRAINQYNSIFTVPQSQGDPKIVKRGPKGDPIFGKKGTQRGPFLT